MTSKQLEPGHVWLGGFGMQAIGVGMGVLGCPLVGVPMVAAGVQTSWCAWKNRKGMVDAGKLGLDILVAGSQSALSLLMPAQSKMLTVQQISTKLTQATVQIGRQLLSREKVDRSVVHVVAREVAAPVAGLAAVQAMNAYLGPVAQVPQEILMRNAANGAVQNAVSQLTHNVIDKAAGEKKPLIEDVIPAMIAGAVTGLEVGLIDIARLPQEEPLKDVKHEEELQIEEDQTHEPKDSPETTPKGKFIYKIGRGRSIKINEPPPKGYHFEICAQGHVKLVQDPLVEPKGTKFPWNLNDYNWLEIKEPPPKGYYTYINAKGDCKLVRIVSAQEPVQQPAPQPQALKPYLVPLPILLHAPELNKQASPVVIASPIVSPVRAPSPATVPLPPVLEEPAEEKLEEDPPLAPEVDEDPILDPDAVAEENLDEKEISDESSDDVKEETPDVVQQEDDLFRLPELPELPDVDDCVVQ